MLRDVLYDNTYFELRKGLITVPENENKTHEVMVKRAKRQYQYIIVDLTVIFLFIIASAPPEEEHNILEEIKMMSSVGIHENVVGLLRICSSEGKPLSYTQ